MISFVVVIKIFHKILEIDFQRRCGKISVGDLMFTPLELESILQL
jgi:hypothetical protein